MSVVPCRTPDMQPTPDMRQNRPPELPWHTPDLPARPAVVPVLPARVIRPGRRAPLPDAVAVRQVTVPPSAPPYDDEAARPAGPGRKPGYSRQSGQAEPTLRGARAGRAALPGQASQDRQPGGPRPADGWPSQFAQVLAETLAGARPARQLAPWTTEQARRRIRQLGPMLATDQRPRLRRVMTSAPAQDVLELTAVVGFGPRVRVLALRLERDRARAGRCDGGPWCCTAIESA
jgi:hypothetical protein